MKKHTTPDSIRKYVQLNPVTGEWEPSQLLRDECVRLVELERNPAGSWEVKAGNAYLHRPRTICRNTGADERPVRWDYADQ